MAMGLFDLWRIIYVRRVDRNGRKLIPPRSGQEAGSGDLRIFRAVAARNIDRARRRWQRAKVPPILEEVGPHPPADGAVV